MENKLSKEDIAYIIGKLREATITWRGRSECLKRARKRVEDGTIKSGPNKGKIKWKFFYQCAGCKEWFRDQESLEVDHIIEIGPFLGSWDVYIPKMFCGQDNLQALCDVCHKRKTSGFNAALRYVRKVTR